MKKIFTFLVAVLFTATLWAQSPEKMSYQAVIRNSSDLLVTNTQIGIEINIRQGSETGTAVYTETQTPTTNANGLVSIKIGGGAGFNTIDWTNGPYYIETKTAIVPPLTTYTITGVSELLSVPYALHAKTAETVSGGITETDPTFTISQAANITATDITNLGNLSGTNTGDQDLSSLATKTALGDSTAQVRSEIPDVSGFLTSYIETDPIFTAWDKDYADLINTPAAADGSETKVTAGYGILLSGAGTTASPYIVSLQPPVVLIPLAIGDSYQGGIIFWIDGTGEHGLIAATADQGPGTQWYNGTSRYTGTTGDGLYAGEMNTAMIVAGQMADNQAGDFGAKVCADYSVTVSGVNYGDWYLPSKYELNLLYAQKAAVGGFSSGYYMSSTEYTNLYAWQQRFNDGSQSTIYKYMTGYVRAVRAF